MCCQLPHATRMSEPAVKESLFPFEQGAHIRLPRAAHVAFTNVTTRGLGIPIRSNHQKSVCRWPDRFSQGAQGQPSTFDTPDQGRMRTYPSIDSVTVLGAIGEEHAVETRCCPPHQEIRCAGKNVGGQNDCFCS